MEHRLLGQRLDRLGYVDIARPTGRGQSLEPSLWESLDD
jgi:hypothetical protein